MYGLICVHAHTGTQTRYLKSQVYRHESINEKTCKKKHTDTYMHQNKGRHLLASSGHDCDADQELHYGIKRQERRAKRDICFRKSLSLKDLGDRIKHRCPDGGTLRVCVCEVCACVRGYFVLVISLLPRNLAIEFVIDACTCVHVFIACACMHAT